MGHYFQKWGTIIFSPGIRFGAAISEGAQFHPVWDYIILYVKRGGVAIGPLGPPIVPGPRCQTEYRTQTHGHRSTAPQPPTHARSGTCVPEFRTSLIQTGAKLSTRGLGAGLLIQLRATRRDVKSPRPKNVLSLSAGSLSGASIIKFLNNSAPAPLCLPGQRMCCREAQEAFPGDP